VSTKRRLEALEKRLAPSGDPAKYEIPTEVQALLTHIERYRARSGGRAPPEHSEEEIRHMRESDLQTVAGMGAGVELRDDPGWQAPEAQALLDSWEEAARLRLEQAEGLPPGRWRELWGTDEEVLDIEPEED